MHESEFPDEKGPSHLDVENLEPQAQPDHNTHTPQHQMPPSVQLVAKTDSRSIRPSNGLPPFPRGLQWTADGTTIITSASDYSFSAFVLPEDLLFPREEPLNLEPQATLRFSEPSYAFAAAPYFSLSEPTTQSFLVSCKDHPIQLHHVFPPEEPAEGGSSSVTDSLLCSYKLIRRETEEFISAESLLWNWPGSHFLVGSTNRLDYFDVSRTGGDGPILTIPTIPSKRHISKGGGVGMKGMVSALSSQSPAVSESPLIAAGTWTRWLGLYDVTRSNKPVANWSIRGVVESEFGHQDDGAGIVQTIWSPCGRYLAVNERQASGILVYDVRGTGRPLTVLTGRDASTQQRLSCDVFSAPSSSEGEGFELWAGSKDGTVFIWEGVGNHSGAIGPSWEFGAHQAPVGGTSLHPSGSVVATCSGAWKIPSDEELDSHAGTRDNDGAPPLAKTRITSDRSLKIWSLGMPEAGGNEINPED